MVGRSFFGIVLVIYLIEIYHGSAYFFKGFWVIILNKFNELSEKYFWFGMKNEIQFSCQLYYRLSSNQF